MHASLKHTPIIPIVSARQQMDVHQDRVSVGNKFAICDTAPRRDGRRVRPMDGRAEEGEAEDLIRMRLEPP